MSHKDAPPETPEQIACREWWEKAQPHVTRAWGRAKDGEFFAEESKLLHQFFMYARNQSMKCPYCGEDLKLAMDDEEIARLLQCERRLAAVTRWLQSNQPDVFSRGLWDAINEA